MSHQISFALPDFMNTKKILLMMLIVAALIGAVGGYFDARGSREPAWWNLTSTVLLLTCIFAWYHADSNLHAYKRSKWLNGGMIAMAALAVPYYVVRRSERGTRLRALLRLLGFCVLLVLAATVGDFVGGLFS